MRTNLLDNWSLQWLETYHFLEKLFKLFHPQSFLLQASLVITPKLLILFLYNQLVELVFNYCKLERQFSEDQSKQNNTKGKDIALRCIIGQALLLAEVNFRCHITLFSALKLIKSQQFPCSPKLGSKSKIANFNRNLPILTKYQQIFQLQIAVGDILIMHKCNSLNNIPKDLFLSVEVKLMLLHIIQQASLLSIFEDQDVFRVFQLFIHFITLKGNILLVSEGLEDVFVVQAFQNQELVFKVPQLLLAERGDHFEHNSVLALSVSVKFGVAACANKRQFILTHRNIRKYYDRM